MKKIYIAPKLEEERIIAETNLLDVLSGNGDGEVGDVADSKSRAPFAESESEEDIW